MISYLQLEQARIETCCNESIKLWFKCVDVMKKICTGGEWRRSSTTGTTAGECQMEAFSSALLVLRGFSESGLGYPDCSPKVFW